MKCFFLAVSLAAVMGQCLAQDYQSGIFSLPVHDATLLKSQESTTLMLALLRGSGTGDCVGTPETYELNLPKFFNASEAPRKADQFIADAVARKFNYKLINISHQTKPEGQLTFTLFKLTGPQGALFGHAVEFKGPVKTVAPDVTTFAARTLLTLCQAK